MATAKKAAATQQLTPAMTEAEAPAKKAAVKRAAPAKKTTATVKNSTPAKKAVAKKAVAVPAPTAQTRIAPQAAWPFPTGKRP